MFYNVVGMNLKEITHTITYTKLTRGRKTSGFEVTFTDTSI